MKNLRAVSQIPSNAIPGTPTVHFVTNRKTGDILAIERTAQAASNIKEIATVFCDIHEKPVFTQFPGYSLTGL